MAIVRVNENKTPVRVGNGGDAVSYLGRALNPTAPTNGQTYVYDSATNTWVASTPAGGSFLPLAGGVMTGALNMGDQFLYGSEASAGLLQLGSTSHATKGIVCIGSAATGFIWDELNERLSLGTNVTSYTLGGVTKTAVLVTETQGGSDAYDLIFHRHGASASTFSGYMRSRGSHASPSILLAGDIVHEEHAYGFDGTDWEEVAGYDYSVEGTPANNVMPGKIQWHTTDAAGVRQDAFSVNSAQLFLINKILGVDTINEFTSAAGVTVDGVVVKDGGAVFTGDVGVGNGTAGFPSIYTTGDPDTGIHFIGNHVIFSSSGIGPFGANSEGAELADYGNLGWSSTSLVHGAKDIRLWRDAAQILAQRAGALAQTYRLYETWTNSTNFSRLSFITAAGDFDIMQEALGTGTLRGLNIGASAGDLCFYEGTPVALQTGVAVSSAGIHAALVALNLITA